jgi:hypothetical protein
MEALPDKVTVVVRARPPASEGARTCVRGDEGGRDVLTSDGQGAGKALRFTYARSFFWDAPGASTTRDVFLAVGWHVLQQALAGFHTSLLAYGQTGACAWRTRAAVGTRRAAWPARAAAGTARRKRRGARPAGAQRRSKPQALTSFARRTRARRRLGQDAHAVRQRRRGGPGAHAGGGAVRAPRGAAGLHQLARGVQRHRSV